LADHGDALDHPDHGGAWQKAANCMKENFTGQRIAQWLVVLLCILTLKLYYSTASADHLRWILAPTSLMVEGVSGVRFAFESGAGYLSEDRTFLIAPSCAGVNFLIAAFLMLAARKLLREGSQRQAWRYLPAAALTAYLVTLIANTVRISVALWLRQMPEIYGLNREQIHRAEGILVYSGCLLLLFVASEKMAAQKSSSLLRQALFPLLVYYAIVLGMPLANGGYRQGQGFWEHSAFVFLIPLLLLLPFAVFDWLHKRLDAGSVSDIRASGALVLIRDGDQSPPEII
jgi:exosortase K